MPAVPLHDGHEVNQNRERAQDECESDISFAAFADGAPRIGQAVIRHDPNAMEKAGSPINFSIIRAANKASM